VTQRTADEKPPTAVAVSLVSRRSRPQLAGPVRIGGIDLQLGQDGLGDAVEQGRLVRLAWA
jgi:hypothetical protein